MINIIKVISTIVGTLIGAGFASGKEIYLFFFRYGIYGVIGIVISSIVIGNIIYKVIYTSRKNKIDNYSHFLDCIIKNNVIKIILKNTIDIFLVISFCIMVSGFCAFLKQEFNIKIIISYIAILIFCYVILQKNISGIIKINNILIPIIVIIIVLISAKDLNGLSTVFIRNLNHDKFNIRFVFDSILYANYNLLTIIPIIITTKKFIKQSKHIKYVSGISTVIIFLLSISIYSILAQGNSCIREMEMPIISIVSGYGNMYKYIYCLIVGIAIVTTAISAGYGYLQKYEENKKIYNRNLIILLMTTLVSISIGFSKLIELLYPIFGLIGILQSYYIIKYK